MQEQIMDYKAGAVVMITEGEYSDYSPHGVFRAVRDFNIKEAVAQWIKAENPKLDDYEFEVSSLIGWLTRNGILEDVPHTELHLGSYGCLPDEFRPDAN